MAATMAAGAALGQGAADVIKARQAGYKAQGAAFKRMGDSLKGATPDIAVVRASAKVLADTSKNQYRWFPKGSGPEAGVKTAAKAEIWTDAAGFAAAQKAFETEAGKLNAAATGGDIGAIRAQAGATARTCGGCHDKFRVKS
ncbi:MAG: cytochrome c [Phenylobacterium sp.]